MPTESNRVCETVCRWTIDWQMRILETKELLGEQKYRENSHIRNQHRKADMLVICVYSPVNRRTSSNETNQSVRELCEQSSSAFFGALEGRQIVFTFLPMKWSDHYRTVCSYKTRSMTNWRDSKFSTSLILQGQPVFKDNYWPTITTMINLTLIERISRLLNRRPWHMHVIRTCKFYWKSFSKCSILNNIRRKTAA